MVGELPATATGWDVPETIEAPIIVYSAPIWNIFQVIPESELPYSFVRLVNNYRTPNIMTSVVPPYLEKMVVLNAKVLDEMEYGGTEMTMAFHMPHTGLPHITSLSGGDIASQRATGEVMFSFLSWELSPALVENKRKENELLEDFEKDFTALHPEMIKHIIEAKTTLRRRAPAWDGLARMPYYTGNFRIDHKSPISGLYFCGDTVRSRGVGIDAAVRSAIWCFNKIMGENVPTFLPL